MFIYLLPVLQEWIICVFCLRNGFPCFALISSICTSKMVRIPIPLDLLCIFTSTFYTFSARWFLATTDGHREHGRTGANASIHTGLYLLYEKCHNFKFHYLRLFTADISLTRSCLQSRMGTSPGSAPYKPCKLHAKTLFS